MRRLIPERFPSAGASLALIAALMAALAVSSVAWAEDVTVVTQAQLQARLTKHDPALVVLDVRTPAEFAAGHLPGALNVPHDQVEARQTELEAARARDVVVYCGAGKRAALALETLKRLGFTRLAHLEGDWNAWQAAGLPSEGSAPGPMPAH